MKQWVRESGLLPGEVRLLDEDVVAGTLTEAVGEPAVIGAVQQDSFSGARLVFFTGSAAFSARHVAEAVRAGATVIDLSGGLANQTDARCWIPSLDPVLAPPLGKPAGGETASVYVAPSAPATVAISLGAALTPLGLRRMVLTLFEPVSERGSEGIEELESQVVKLLSFAPIPKAVFDAQVGFNLLSRFGEASGEKLADRRAEIVGCVRRYLGGRAGMPAITLVQAPVFYSHVFSAYAEFESAPAIDDLVSRIERAGLKVVAPDQPAPDNVNVTGESRPVLARPERDPAVENGVWLWGAADNLRVPVVNAVAIAEKLLAS